MEMTPPLHRVNYDTLINTAKPGQVENVLRKVIAELVEEVEDFREKIVDFEDDFDSGMGVKAEEILELIYYGLKKN